MTSNVVPFPRAARRDSRVAQRDPRLPPPLSPAELAELRVICVAQANRDNIPIGQLVAWLVDADKHLQQMADDIALSKLGGAAC